MGGNWKDINNYYEILEVDPNASIRDIHDAYKRAKATYSNDNVALYSMFSRDEARELLRLVEEAYAVLGDAQAKERYDHQMSGGDGNADAPTQGVLTRIQGNTYNVPEAQSTPFHISDADWRKHPPAFRDDSVGSVKVKEKKKPLSGTATTQFGTYTIDAATEAEIEARSDFDGSFLKKVRQYKNINMEQMSTVTRISRTYLTAVEDMDLRALPAPVFVRGFVCHVARALGLNEKKVADSYMKLLKAQLSDKAAGDE